MKNSPVKRLLAMALCLSMLLSFYVPSASAEAVSYHDMTMGQLLDLDEDLTWVFAGDSITHNGTYTNGDNDYAAWFEKYLYDIGRGGDVLINTAWGGADIQDFQYYANTANGQGAKADAGMGLEQFVTKYDPDVVFIKLGMNNRGMSNANFTSLYNAMLDGIYAEGAKNGKTPKVILLSPTPLSGEFGISSGEFGSDSTDEAFTDSVKRFSTMLDGIARERGLEFVDLRQAMIDESINLGDRYHYTFFTDGSDGKIHPNAAGQYFMFQTICKELGLYDASMPIFQVSYDDLTDAALYGDNTAISYTGSYGVNHPDSYDEHASEMDKVMPELEIQEVQDNGPELLAAIDFNSTNGSFVGGSTYDGATRVDLTNAEIMDDALTLAEAQSLEREYTLVFRARLDPSHQKNQPVLWITAVGDQKTWDGAVALGAQGNGDQIYYSIKSGSTSVLSNTNATPAIDTNKTASNGAWHTIAYVQTTAGLEYYVDGAKVNTLAYYVKEGNTIGQVFANPSLFAAHIGSYGTIASSYHLDGDLDYYQLYKGALSADDIKALADSDGTAVDDGAEMNKTMPSVISDATPLASVDFDSTTGNFPYAESFGKAKLVDLTDAEVVDDVLTLEEAQALDREFSIVLRAKLASTSFRPHQALLMLTPGADSVNWNNAIAVGGPGNGNNLYYEVRQGGAEKTSSPNTISLKNTPTTNVRNDWHTIAIVQRTDGLDYYIDGVLAETWAYKLNDGVTMGSVFANATDIMAHFGSFARDSAGTYCLQANMDYYQLYGKALTAEQVATLGNGSNTAAQMNSTMPQAPAEEVRQTPELLASVDFDATNGTFVGGSDYAKATRVDLTDANVMDDALTLEEAQAMGREFSLVFRGRLDSTTHQVHQALLMMTPGTDNDWNNAISVGGPGKANNLYYEVRKDGKENVPYANVAALATDTANVTDGWHTIAIVQRTDGMDYYIDGVLAQTLDHKLNDGVTLGSLFADATEITAHVGSFAKNSAGTYNLKAKMDFYQLYSGALNADEVKAIADNAGMADDRVQMNKTMTSASGATPLASVEFTGENGYLDFGNAAGLRIDTATEGYTIDTLTQAEAATLKNSFSVVFRAKLDGTYNTNQPIVFISANGTDNWDNALVLGVPAKSNQLYFNCHDGKAAVSGVPAVEGTNVNGDGQFHTVAVTYDNGTLTYYVDGVQMGQTAGFGMKTGYTTFGDLFANSENFAVQIGRYGTVSDGTSYKLKGDFDFWQFYGSALTAQQIRELSGLGETAQWTDTVAVNNLWAVIGADQMSGYLGQTPNFSLFRLLNNGMRGGANEPGSYRDIRMMNLAKPGQTVAQYSAALSGYRYDVLMVLPELPEVHAAGYVHSEDKVAAYKANLLSLIEENAGKPIVLWTPLASVDATVNGYIDDYAEAVRQIATADPSVLFFDANRFMNERMATVGTNWFDDSMHISPLCATDLAYAFFVNANYPYYTSGTASKNPTHMGELASHNLRLSSDKRLYKSGVIKENLSYGVSVSGGNLTVDASAIAAQGYTNLRVAVIPAIGIGSVINPWILGDAGQSLEAPHSNPCITVYGEKDGVTYRFKDVQVTLTTSNNYTEPYFETNDLTALRVVGAPAIGFDPSKTTYDVELYQYQRQVRLVAEGGSNLTIQVNGKTVKSGEFSQYIAVEDNTTVTVTVTGGTADKTYTLNLTKPDYADIIITEIMTDGYDGYHKKGADNYELIEIYNASGEDLNLLDYSIGYIREYPYENDIGDNSNYPYYFTGNDQIFYGQSYLGINQITKYSSSWSDKVDQEPEEVIFPADSTMVIWVKFSKDAGTDYGSSLTYETLISALEAHSGTHTLTVDVEENGETVTKTIVPNQDQLVVAEIPYGAAQSNVTQNITTTATNFYMDGFQVQQDYDNRRGWLFVLDDSAVRDYYGALTEAGDDIISAARFVRPGYTHKLSSVMYYDVERGLSMVKNAGTWDTSYSTGHTSDQQGYANKTSFGAVEYWQKPYDFGDTTAAVIANNTQAAVLKDNAATIRLAITDDQDIRYVELHVDADNDGTYETVVKKDVTLITSASNAGKAADVKAFELNYAVENVQSEVHYYGFVLDGNNNKTELAPATIRFVSACEHSWDNGVVTAPTCTEDGYTTYTCTVCCLTRTENVVPANGEHNYDDGVVTKAPTYGEDGEMTYTCSVCGHSYTEAIDALTGIATVNGQTYDSLTEAVENANGNVIALLTDVTDSTSIAANVTIDLAGKTLKNVTVAEGYTLTLIDTENDDYAGNGYAEVNGDVNTYANVNGKDYIVVSDNGKLSAHRYAVVIDYISLKPDADALGYRATVMGDETVQSAVTGYGFDMSVADGKVVTYEKDVAPTNGKFTLRLKSIMASDGGEKSINAVAFVKFGTQTVESKMQTTTMKATILAVNGMTTLTETQKAAVGQYYDTFRAVMAPWFAQVGTNNIDAWYTEEA